MNMTVLLLEFAPLVIYIGVDYFKGFRAGIYAALVTSAAVLAYDHRLTGEWDGFAVGETALIVGLGWVSLKMNNDRYFKFQPMVVAFIFSGLFAYFQAFDKPLMLRFLPHMQKLFAQERADAPARAAEPAAPRLGSPSMRDILDDPKTEIFFSRMSFASIWLFLGHGLVMGYAAMRLSTRAWFACRMAIYPALLVLVVMVQLWA